MSQTVLRVTVQMQWANGSPVFIASIPAHPGIIAQGPDKDSALAQLRENWADCCADRARREQWFVEDLPDQTLEEYKLA